MKTNRKCRRTEWKLNKYTTGASFLLFYIRFLLVYFPLLNAILAFDRTTQFAPSHKQIFYQLLSGTTGPFFELLFLDWGQPVFQLLLSRRCPFCHPLQDRKYPSCLQLSSWLHLFFQLLSSKTWLFFNLISHLWSVAVASSCLFRELEEVKKRELREKGQRYRQCTCSGSLMRL